MADDQLTPALPIETPPASVQPAPPPEPLDERGVPYRNRVAEMERKLAEAQERELQYQTSLGQYLAQAQKQAAAVKSAASTDDTDLGEYDAKQIAAVRRIATEVAKEISQQTAFQLIGRAQLTQELGTDQELQQLANVEYRNITANPYYATWPDDARQALAVKEAKVKWLEKKQQTAQANATKTALQDAAAAQAANASLPGTGGGVGPIPAGQDRETYIKTYMADEQNRTFFKKFHGLDPLSTEGAAKFRKVAETAASGISFGGKTGVALEILSGGKQ